MVVKTELLSRRGLLIHWVEVHSYWNKESHVRYVVPGVHQIGVMWIMHPTPHPTSKRSNRTLLNCFRDLWVNIFLFNRIWSIRFNHFHDQLVLSSSSDSRVILTNTTSISSEPFGHLAEEDEPAEGEGLEYGDEDNREKYGVF